MYRMEHPKPQFERKNWCNLNGEWDFCFDFGNSGLDRGLQYPTAKYDKKINVPFCPESELSGIGYKDFINAVWYKRSFDITLENLEGIVLLHFGAVDYEANIYVNGEKCGAHKGGYISFSVDITDYVHVGENVLIVQAIDDVRNRLVARGKQSERFNSYGCYYTRTTGIWQTVWLEFVPKTYVKKAKYYPDIHSCSVQIETELCGVEDLRVEAFFEGKKMGETHIKHAGGTIRFSLPLKEKRLWEVGKGNLYDLYFYFGEDVVKSYFGLRSVRLDGYKFLINEKSVFQRLVLDQGFYPDGIYTAPNDKELENDIERSIAMGFNGARLHEKIFEERFLYYCDKKGYIVWGEFPNWGVDISYADSIYGILPEWLEEIDRDFNHPSIIGWCPFNETWDRQGRKQYDDVLRVVYLATKAIDSTRPCIDTSGNYHVKTDIFDLHDYTQDSVEFKKRYGALQADGRVFNAHEDRQEYIVGMPVFISEYGGMRWSNDVAGWGYGTEPQTEEEFLSRLQGLTDVLLDCGYMFGFCYTQLTDIENEQNGLYTYDRYPKFAPERIAKIFTRKAKIED